MKPTIAPDPRVCPPPRPTTQQIHSQIERIERVGRIKANIAAFPSVSICYPQERAL